MYLHFNAFIGVSHGKVARYISKSYAHPILGSNLPGVARGVHDLSIHWWEMNNVCGIGVSGMKL